MKLHNNYETNGNQNTPKMYCYIVCHKKSITDYEKKNMEISNYSYYYRLQSFIFNRQQKKADFKEM